MDINLNICLNQNGKSITTHTHRYLVFINSLYQSYNKNDIFGHNVFCI